MQNFNIRKYTINTFILYVSAIIIAISIVSLFSYNRLSHIIENETEDSNLESLSLSTSNVDNLLKSLDRNTIALVDNTYVKQYIFDNYQSNMDINTSKDAVQQLLRTFTYSNEGVQSVYVYSDISKRVITSTYEIALEEFGDTGWMDTWRNMEQVLAWQGNRVIHDDTTNIDHDCISLIRVIPMSVNNNYGAIVVNIDSTLFDQVVKSYLREYSERSVYIVDAADSIVYDESREDLGQKIPSSLSEKLSASERGYIKITFDGVKSVAFWTTSSMTDWRYINIVSEHSVYIARKASIQSMVWILMIVVLLSVLVLFWLNKLAIRPVKSYVVDVNENIKSNQDTIQYRFISELISERKIAQRSIENYIHQLHIALDLNSFAVMIVKLINAELDKPEMLEGSSALANESAKSIFSAFSTTEMVGVLTFSEYDVEKNMEIAKHIAETIKLFLTYEFGVDLTISIGNVVREIDEIGLSYNLANNALKYYAVMDKNSILTYEYIKNQMHGDPGIIINKINKINLILIKLQFDEATLLIEDMFDEIQSSHVSIDYIRQFTAQIIIALMGISKENGLSVEMLEEIIPNLNTYGLLEKQTVIDDFKQILFDLMKLIEDGIADKTVHIDDGQAIIRSVMEYTDANYVNPDISLSFIGEKFNISPFYLSRNFKNYAGTSFLEYLIGKRMNAAKDMLLDSNVKIKDIAEATGYLSYKSFVKIFKKYVGLTPSEFRDIHKPQP